MNKFNIVEHYRNLSTYLYSQYILSSTYGHSGSKGQIREEFLTDTLKAIAPDDIRICKGEICDSNGFRSPEFDIIISHYSTAIKLFSSAINYVIPIETVLGIIEVKSILSKEGLGKFNTDLTELNSFQRYYIPTDSYKFYGELTGDKEYKDLFSVPIKPTDNIRGITRIIGGVFAFDAPHTKTVKTWLDSIETELNLAYVCVLNRFFAMKDELGKWQIAETGRDTFAAFASVYYGIANCNEREINVKCDSSRYIEYAAKNGGY